MDNKVLDEAVEAGLAAYNDGNATDLGGLIENVILAGVKVLMGPKIATVHEGDYMTRAVVWHEAAGDLERGETDLYAPDLGGGK